jgi:chaperonin GroEL
MSKEIVSGKESRIKIMAGVNKLADAVSATLGPKGRHVVMERQFGSPLITKDGATVAREISLRDPVENMGAQMVKEAADRTANSAGDGTTTATILARSIFQQGLEHINTAIFSNPVGIKRGIDKAVEAVAGSKGFLQQQSRVVSGETISQVASISANGDESIGTMIAQAFNRVGKDGVITVEESRTMDTTLEVVEGMSFDKGYLSPYFATDPAKEEVVYENVLIFMYDKKITGLNNFVKFLQEAIKVGKPIVIIAEDLDQELLTTLVLNRIRQGTQVVAVRAPSFGNYRKKILEDIAIITGGKVFSDDLDFKIENVKVSELGTARKIVITQNETVILDGHGDKEAIAARIKQLKSEIANCTSDLDRDKLYTRLSKMVGGVGVIKVGTISELEMKEKTARIEDALHATRAAIEEGIVPGGGVALARCISHLKSQSFLDTLVDKDESIGAGLVEKALEIPLLTIAGNSGMLNAKNILKQVLDSDSLSYGFDAQTSTFVDMFEAGIVDPLKVTRNAVRNAGSVAGIMLTTEATIYTSPETSQNDSSGISPA